jgi:nucleotide-binding universal stress UspA family protein
MKRTILVPLDGSAQAETVFPHAVAAARATNSTITLLQVVASSSVLEASLWPAGVPVGSMIDSAEERRMAYAYLQTTASNLRASGVEFATLVLEGDPATEIVNRARSQAEVSMIAMATHGRSGIGRWVFGSVAEKVLHGASVPLLLARIQAEPSPAPVVPAPGGYKTILVPLDGSRFAEQALVQAAGLAAHSDARLLLVTVVPTLEDLIYASGGLVPYWLNVDQEAAARTARREIDLVAHCLQEEGIRAHGMVARGWPAETILREAEQEQADLIVMTTHGRTGIGKFWLGSVAMKVIQRATRPVLLVRAVESKVRVGEETSTEQEAILSGTPEPVHA